MPKIEFSEKELEDFLCVPGNLEKYLGLKFVARQVRTSVGVVDILACSPEPVDIYRWDIDRKVKGRRWYILELKKDTLDAAAFFQVNRYKHFFDNVYDSGGSYGCVREFVPVLVGASLSSDLIYSVEHLESGCWHTPGKTYYTLFGCKFDSPISFDYYSKPQKGTVDSYEEIRDYFENAHSKTKRFQEIYGARVALHQKRLERTAA